MAILTKSQQLRQAEADIFADKPLEGCSRCCELGNKLYHKDSLIKALDGAIVAVREESQAFARLGQTVLKLFTTTMDVLGKEGLSLMVDGEEFDAVIGKMMKNAEEKAAASAKALERVQEMEAQV